MFDTRAFPAMAEIHSDSMNPVGVDHRKVCVAVLPSHAARSAWGMFQLQH
jgi:hypothetical protein